MIKFWVILSVIANRLYLKGFEDFCIKRYHFNVLKKYKKIRGL